MKKTFSLVIAIALVAALTLSASAALFTDFDSWADFKAGGNPCYTDEDAADYWIGEWNGGNLLDDPVFAEITDGKGVNGSKGLVVYEDGMTNVGLYLFGKKAGIATDYTGSAYLRVWMDLTEVGFRKANWGVIDSSYSLFTTDEVDTDGLPFYYLADGSADWVEMFHGGDGCFGDTQDSDVFGFKGYFAFPVADFWIRENANWEGYDAGTAANAADIHGVYLFWDYSDMLMGGEKFTVDNIEFVADYKVFEPLPSEIEEEPAAAPAAGAYPASGVGGNIISGALIGNETGWGDNADTGRAAAFDGDAATFFDPLGVGDGYCGVDAGEVCTLEKVAILSRDGWASRFLGAMIQGSNDGENWTTLWTSDAEAVSTTEYTVITDLQNNTGYRYYRYFNETSHGDVAEVEFYRAGAAPAAAAAPVAAAAPAKSASAAQTGDIASIAVIALAASLSAAVIIKKRR
ncbi:MAG: discoidin domain-containing protein [Clostridiales bacterium]|jgi:hypothetical protein|nr:discoidin domain-containing protein [Clostridiales bacterium]